MHYTLLEDMLKLSTNNYADVRSKAQKGMGSSRVLRVCSQCSNVPGTFTLCSAGGVPAVLPRGQV
jgi:hypothetical protein